MRSVELEPDPSTLPADPSGFAIHVRMYVGSSDEPGEDSFDLTVCTPEWLARTARDEIYNARHHLIVNFESFDKRALHAWLERRVQSVQGDSWEAIGERLSRLAHWEYEDYEG